MLRVKLIPNRKGAVSLLFAIMIIPMLMMVGLAVDYGMYSEAQAQLDTAADTAAIHAARVASELLQQNDLSFLSKGKLAGQAWFAAQLGNLPQAAQSSPALTVTMSYAAGNKAITAQVNYTDIILAHFGKLFPNNWPHWPNWDIAGKATAVISIPAYVEVLMLLDNSSSMLIGASPDDISALQELTPCSTQSALEGQTMDSDYSWAYTQSDGQWLWNPPSSAASPQLAPGSVPKAHLPYGYGYLIYPGTSTTTALVSQFAVPPSGQVGNCDYHYDGTSKCIYPGTIPGLDAQGQCPNGIGGGAGTIVNLAPALTVPTYTSLAHFPQAPCAFACHNDKSNSGKDYWGLAQQNNITTRYTVLHQAAGEVIQKMRNNPTPGQLSIGVYQFTEKGLASANDPGVSVVYPGSGQEAGPVSGGGMGRDAAMLTANIQPPITDDRPDTNFENAMTYMNTVVAPAGTGLMAASPKKNMFIVTDGLDDYYAINNTSGRVQQAIDPAACTVIKNRGVKIYVLYTKYYPLPNPYYIGNDLLLAENPSGTPPETATPIEKAMAACSSDSDTDPQEYFYEASEAQSIRTALNNMLAAAIGSAGRLSN